MGIRTGVVVGQEVKTWKGSDIALRIVNVQLLGDKPEEVEWFDIAGGDTAPVNGDRVVVFEFAQNYKVAVLTKDLIVSSVNFGERKFYSRDVDGVIVATIHLKNDGTIQFDADKDLIANVTGDLIFTLSEDFAIVVASGKTISLGNGTDEVLDLMDQILDENIKLVDSTLLGGGNTVDAPGVASTGTLAVIATPLATMKTDLTAIKTALGNIKV